MTYVNIKRKKKSKKQMPQLWTQINYSICLLRILHTLWKYCKMLNDTKVIVKQ